MGRKSRATKGRRAPSKTVLIVDDEPLSLEWLSEYVAHLGFFVEFAGTQAAAVRAIAKTRYRALIIDLGIPASADMPRSGPRDLYERYPGLAVANVARNAGYLETRVFVYSVHDSDEVDEELNSLKCLYLLKGRPRQAKEEIRRALLSRQ